MAKKTRIKVMNNWLEYPFEELMKQILPAELYAMAKAHGKANKVKTYDLMLVALGVYLNG